VFNDFCIRDWRGKVILQRKTICLVLFKFSDIQPAQCIENLTQTFPATISALYNLEEFTILAFQTRKKHPDNHHVSTAPVISSEYNMSVTVGVRINKVVQCRQLAASFWETASVWELMPPTSWWCTLDVNEVSICASYSHSNTVDHKNLSLCSSL